MKIAPFVTGNPRVSFGSPLSEIEALAVLLRRVDTWGRPGKPHPRRGIHSRRGTRSDSEKRAAVGLLLATLELTTAGTPPSKPRDGREAR